MRLGPFLAVATLAFVALAGCSDDTPQTSEDPVDRDEFDIRAGTGAIAGLLVDDRFRPIHLTDDPQTEFDAEGFVLLQETGEQVKTTENGEFVFTDLEPGTYTLRVTAAGHEAVPQKVQVTEGVFSELSVVARRLVNVGATIVTQEYSIFIPCNAYATFECPPDGSGDTYRPGIRGNFSEFLPEVTYSVWEVLLNNPHVFCLEVREEGTAGAATARHFGNWCRGQDNTYLKGILLNGEIYDEVASADPWDPAAQTDGILFTFGNNEATCWQGAPVYRCVGVSFGVRAQIIVSFFIGEPEVDVESYCLLC